MQHPSVIPQEIAQFNALAARWWDANGPMRPLHMMNGPRAAWVAERVRNLVGPGVEILDVGCGAGLLAEALAKQGFDVLGVDAGVEVIEAARSHAQGQDLSLEYRNATAEELVQEGLKFPVVTALEIIEHVADPVEFLRSLAALAGAGRAPVPLHPQPHAQILPHGQAGCGIHSPPAARGHA